SPPPRGRPCAERVCGAVPRGATHPRPAQSNVQSVDHRGDVAGPIQGELHQLVERMRALTRATAAYVLMVEDDELVQRAVSGAPPAATRLRLARPGLCSTALSTGEPILCPDLEADTRPHQGDAREHRMRSTVIVPVTADSGPVAVLIVSAD